MLAAEMPLHRKSFHELQQTARSSINHKKKKKKKKEEEGRRRTKERATAHTSTRQVAGWEAQAGSYSRRGSRISSCPHLLVAHGCKPAQAGAWSVPVATTIMKMMKKKKKRRGERVSVRGAQAAGALTGRAADAIVQRAGHGGRSGHGKHRAQHRARQDQK
mgnify:CR=1 FL=1